MSKLNPSAEIIIDHRGDKTHYALVYDGQLWQMITDGNMDTGAYTVGAIVCGRVIKRLNNVHALVDIGAEKEAFLEASASAAPEGSMVLAQIRRDAFHGKGATLTLNIMYYDRYLSFHPGADVIETVNQNLMNDLGRLGWSGQVKPAAKQIDRRQLLDLAKQQIAKHQNLMSSYEKKNQIGIISQAPSASDRLWFDVAEIKKILVNDRSVFNQLQSRFTAAMPDLIPHLEYYAMPKPIFDHYDILDQWDKAFLNAISLPNASRLVFESTQTLHVIDIDHAGAVVDPVTINKNAVSEIARQINLRNWGGLIVIDFLKMRQNSDRMAIQQILEQSFSLDTHNTHVLGFTKAGLFEITRPRKGSPIQPF